MLACVSTDNTLVNTSCDMLACVSTNNTLVNTSCDMLACVSTDNEALLQVQVAGVVYSRSSLSPKFGSQAGLGLDCSASTDLER